MVAVDLQLSASHVDWPTLRAASMKAEADGYDALWVLDHLAGATLGGHHNLECFTWLGALAEATSTIELGALVANTWNRQLGTLAVAAASVSAISARRFWFGIGAGTAPDSRWAAEQWAVGAVPPADLGERQARVEQLLDLTDEMWRADRHHRFATFARPSPTPPRIVGTNSVRLSTIAGRRAEGVNVAWEHPRRDELLDAARRAAAGRPFVTTTWVPWSPELLDPGHPTRVAMARVGVDRVILTALDAQQFLDTSTRP
jgi:alkanesulfonate monooxygenase SsuD/methylene tetrahydromethanopterin reductase-like flavin-dependent oxidoreductase (luciferase family)